MAEVLIFEVLSKREATKAQRHQTFSGKIKNAVVAQMVRAHDS